jgi:hypothetical protein
LIKQISSMQSNSAGFFCIHPSYGQRRDQFSIVGFHRLWRISIADSAFLCMFLASGDYFSRPIPGR